MSKRTRIARPDDTWIRDLYRSASIAKGRVGATTIEQLEWLVDFLDRDLQDVNESRKTSFEIHAFVKTLSRDRTGHTVRRVGTEDDNVHLEDQLPTVKEVREYQKKTRRAFDQLFDTRPVNEDDEVNAEWRDVGFYDFPSEMKLRLDWLPGGQVRFVTRQDGSREFIMAVASLLISAGKGLHVCENQTCRRPFLKHDGRQKFHDAQCGDTHRKRTRRKETYDERNRRYQEEVKPAKVQSRGPRRKSTKHSIKK